MKRENNIVFSDNIIIKTVENPISMKEQLKMEIIQYINNKKGYIYVVDKQTNGIYS